jgi:Mg2+ and Co2+ transporter CorA
MEYGNNLSWPTFKFSPQICLKALRSGLVSADFPTKMSYAFLMSSMRATCHVQLQQNASPLYLLSTRASRQETARVKQYSNKSSIFRDISPCRRLKVSLHNLISKKMEFFMTTSVRTSNATYYSNSTVNYKHGSSRIQQFSSATTGYTRIYK